MLKKRLLWFIFAHLSCFFLSGQKVENQRPVWQIKPVINSGFILVHRATIGHLVKGYPSIYELNISQPTLGNQLWQRENNLPDIGISIECVDFKNPKQLGYAFTASPYMEIPLNKKQKPSRLILRLCWGVTYLNKRFDIHNNPKNIAIGSHFNSFVQFKWFWHLRLSDRLRFEPGFAFTHASNGKYKNPNLGLNIVSLNAGINYLIRPKPLLIPAPTDSATKVKSKNELFAFAAVGFNQNRVNGATLIARVFSICYQRNLRNTHKFSGGLDFFYDDNYFVDYQNEFRSGLNNFERMRMSARLGYSYNVGRVSFPIEIGYYIFQKYNPDAALVSRLGVRYYSANGIVAHFGLRTHYAVAYNFEFGLGYRFFIK